MPDNNKGGDQGGGAIKSRSAQSGPPDDKERDSTQRGDQGDQGDQLTKSGKQREQQNDEENAERSAKSGTGGQRPGSVKGDNDR